MCFSDTSISSESQEQGPGVEIDEAVQEVSTSLLQVMFACTYTG
jgi:hypothetical protein